MPIDAADAPPGGVGQGGSGDIRAATVRPFGIAFSDVTQGELIDAILADHAGADTARTVMTANLDHVVTLRRDPRFRAAYDAAWRVTADGTPVFLYARSVGVPLRERVTGSDLFAALVDRWRPGTDRLFLMVSSATTGAAITAILRARGFAAGEVAVEVPPFGFERDDAYGDALIARIAAFGASHLVLGVGAPKSEIWAHANRLRLPGIVVLCVGASIEFVTGEKRRAPVLLRRIGMEWLWRFGTEPRRLFTRYFVRSFGFLAAIAEDRRVRRLAGPR